jgi:hypothetical protein
MLADMILTFIDVGFATAISFKTAFGFLGWVYQKRHRHSGMRLFGAGPEAILPVVVMDSGLAQERAPE